MNSRWDGAPGVSEREVLARSAAEYADVIATLEADRAALVAQLEAAERRGDGWRQQHDAMAARALNAEAQLAALTRERDEARAAHAHVKGCLHTAEARASRAELDLSALQDTDAELLAAYNAKHAKVTGLTEALVAAAFTVNENALLTARVAELTRERDGAENKLALDDAIAMRVSAETEVTRLTEALAAAEERAYSNAAVARDEIASAERMSGLLAAADVRVRELEAEVNGLREQCRRDRESAEARVRELAEREGDQAIQAAEARVEALEVLLAASEARAAQWQADAESYRADATVAQDRLAAGRAECDARSTRQHALLDDVAALKAKVEAALKWADDGLEGEALAYHMVEALRG